MTKHFTHLSEHTPQEIFDLVDTAMELKKGAAVGRPLAGKNVALCFMNPSLRTQVSLQVATTALGGNPVVLNIGASTWQMEYEEGVLMDGNKPEHVKEAVPVLSRFCRALALRSFPAGNSWEEDKQELNLSAFRKYSSVPVINMESATGHPCQALADLMTIRERMNPKGKNFLLTWAPHIKNLPVAVPNSAAEIAAMAGMNLTIARPEGFDLDSELMGRLKSQCRANGSKLTVTEDVTSAYQDAHVVYAKAWGSILNGGPSIPQDSSFRAKWMPTADKMKRTDNAIFLHCLPVRRNVEVADEVLDGPWSAVIDEAENRLHTAKAVLLKLLGNNRPLSSLPRKSFDKLRTASAVEPRESIYGPPLSRG
jgi:N-acetylornithine carbamoyltransferase